MTAQDFITSLPSKVNPAAVAGMSTIFHFDLAGDGGGQYTLKVDDGQVSVTPGLEGEARCKVSAKAEHLVGVVTGDINPMMAVLTGKIKVSNQGELIKYAKVLGLM